MSDDNESPGRVLLNFTSAGAYPSSGFDLDLVPSDCQSARAEISEARDLARTKIRSISRSVAPDVDGWISQAQQLQQDIERSKAIARQVVKEAEQAQELKASRNELQQKLKLLEVEVDFTKRVQSFLQTAKDVATRLSEGQEALKHGRLHAVLEHLESNESVFSELRPLEATNGFEILRERSTRLRATLEEKASTQWDDVIQLNGNTLSISKQTDNEATASLISKLNLIEPKLLKLSRDIDRCILIPRMRRCSDRHHPRLSYQPGKCMVEYDSSGRTSSPSELLEDLTSFINFLHDNLPPELSIHLSENLMPSVASRLILDWLHESIPTSLQALPHYEALLDQVTSFSKHLANIGWHGGANLNDWVEQAPKEWLARRREASIMMVRDILSERVKWTKEVERIETQMVSKGDVMAHTTGTGDDDWDTAWDEEGKGPQDEPVSKLHREDEEDVSAWGLDADHDSQSEAQDPSGKASHTNGEAHDDANEEDAWGWEDQGSSPVTSKHHASAGRVNGGHVQNSGNHTQDRELTLKEKYTITAVPDELLTVIIQIIDDATNLQSDAFSSSPVQPAATALYSLPTLILAGYRSLAPHFYTALPGGNMYLYNDSMRLSASITSYSAQLATDNATAARRSKLDADLDTLISFGKRAYGKEMEAQRTILRDLLDSAQGFANCTEQPYARECESAVLMTLDRIKAVAAEWQPILSQSAWLQSLGSLLSAVVNKVLLDILDLSDISEAESTQLGEYCTQLGTLSELFTKQGASSEGDKQDMTGIYTPSWFRFQYLGEILESNLADIKYMWQEEGLKLEFDSSEVVDLVEALFADSDRRRQAIAEIRRGRSGH